MPPLKIEVLAASNEWVTLGQINSGDQYGSMSDNTDHGRDIYYFGVDAVEGVAVIKKSLAGMDIANSKIRVIHDLGGVGVVASLALGEQYEMTIQPDASPAPRHLRFTHEQ